MRAWTHLEQLDLLPEALPEALREALPGHEIATLLTQVVVDPDDPAFQHPTKPIGPTYVEADARRLAAERGWSVAPDGQAYRRVVSSPEPQRIVELEAIRLLSRAGVTVICAGGGGVPLAARAKVTMAPASMRPSTAISGLRRRGAVRARRRGR